MERIRIGAVRASGSLVRQNPAWFRAFLDEINNLEKHQALGGSGGYSDAVDFIGSHPEFDEVDDDGGPIPVYNVFQDSNGKAKIQLIQGRED